MIIQHQRVLHHILSCAEGVARYLLTVKGLADYVVVYHDHTGHHEVTAEGFLALHEAGRLPPCNSTH